MAARIKGEFFKMAEAWKYLGADGRETTEGSTEIREGKLNREEMIIGAIGQGC